jgi:hypothetical protein
LQAPDVGLNRFWPPGDILQRHRDAQKDEIRDAFEDPRQANPVQGCGTR